MSDSNPPPNDALTAATQMVKNGRLDQARETLMGYLVKNPSSEQAWLLMSYVLSDPAKQKDCLERVLRINPNNTVAQSKLAHLLGRRTEELFRRKEEPLPTVAPLKTELEPTPEPRPEPAAVEPKPLPVAVPEPPPAKRPGFTPIPGASKPEPLPEKVIPPAPPIPSSVKKPLFSGKWFRIITIILVVLILVLAAVILYIGVISPAINASSITPTATLAPANTVAYPPKWTQTLTPTVTPTPPSTLTHTLTPTLAPTETTIS